MHRVAAPGLVCQLNRAFRENGQRLFRPRAVFPFPRFQAARHIVQQAGDDEFPRGFNQFQRLLRIGRKQALRFAQFAFVQLHCQKAACTVFLLAALPVRFQMQQQLPRQIAHHFAIARQGQ